MNVIDVQLQALLDKQALHELVTRLSRGVDRCDRELIISCYHTDADDENGPYKGGPEGFADWVIARRQVITECVSAEPGLDIADFTLGAQDRNDPCYRRD